MRVESELIALLGKTSITPAVEQAALKLLDRPFDLTELGHRLKACKAGRAFDLHLSRVLPPESARLQEIRSAIYAADPRLERFAAHREEMRSALLRSARVSAAAGVDMMAVKGASLFLLLPRYDTRALSDLDLMMRDPVALWSATGALIADGYALDESEAPWLQNFSQDGDPDLQGHITLSDPAGGPGLDLHSCSMNFALTALLRSQLWTRARRTELDGVPMYVPTPEDAWLFLVAHACNHGYFTQKDWNDAYELLLAYRDGFDWRYTWEMVKANRLEGCASYVLTELRQTYGWTPPVEVAGCLGRRTLISRLVHRYAPVSRARRSSFMEVLIPALITGAYEGGPGRRLAAWPYFWRTVVKYAGDELLMAEEKPAWVEPWLMRRERAPYFRPWPRYGAQILLTEIDAHASVAVRALAWDAKRWYGVLSQFGECRLLPQIDAVLLTAEGQEMLLCPAGFFAATVSMLFTESSFALQARVAEAVAALAPLQIREKEALA